VVADTGMGIPQEFLPFVFDRFRQADGSMARRHGGLGLGLAIVRNLVELHGGAVRADSEGPGRGAQFTVTLPLTAGDRRASDPAQAAPGEHIALDGVRILLVDDDETVQEMVARALELHGATVVSASSGAEALRVLPGCGARLMISDLGMPEMTGFELLERVRALPPDQGGAIPAFALTAFASEADQRKTLRAGFAQHFSKPVDFTALVRAIHALGLRERP
jgi:CheY-like chemotaxis protein